MRVVEAERSRSPAWRRLAWLSLALAVAATGAWMAALAGEAAALAERGERLVARHCGACHAVGRADPSPDAAAPPLRDLGVDYPPRHLAEALAEGIVTGHAGMPEFRFAPGEIAAIVAHLEGLSAPDPRRRPDG
jgi:mono/diheme cytochrome c family protein